MEYQPREAKISVRGKDECEWQEWPEAVLSENTGLQATPPYSCSECDLWRYPNDSGGLLWEEKRRNEVGFWPASSPLPLTHWERQKGFSLLKFSILQKMLWVEGVWGSPLFGVHVQSSQIGQDHVPLKKTANSQDLIRGRDPDKGWDS